MLGLSAVLTIGIPTVMAVVYYGFWASSEYVTKFEFAVRGPERPGNDAVGSLIGLPSASVMVPDAYIVTNFINSEQAVEEVDHDVNLRAMFARPNIDFWSRLGANESNEQLAAYWKDMVSARFDLMTGIVSVSVSAFTPHESLNVADSIIARSTAMFSELNREAQQDLVSRSEEYLARAEKKLHDARQALQSFRGTAGVIDPSKVAAEDLQATYAGINKLRDELNSLKTQYASLRALSPHSPSLPAMATRMRVLQEQIAKAQAAGPGDFPEPKQASPASVGQYEALTLDYQFAEKLYTSALEARDKVHSLAEARQVYLALFIKPSLAQAPLYPDRSRSILTVLVAAAAAWFIGVLLAYSIRDHLV